MLFLIKRKIRSLQKVKQAILRREPWQVCQAVLFGNSQLPTHAKHATLLQYAQKFNLTTFFETGTYRGDTLTYLLPYFRNLYSIELSKELYHSAKQKFQNYSKIHLFHGDSASCLPLMLQYAHERALIWLDAHYSGGYTARGKIDTPIVQELNLLFDTNKFGHIILIDDAREFGADPAYPTLEDIAKIAQRNDYNFECIFDIIRLTPKKDKK